MEKADEAVRQTNDSATANKLVCVSKGYFADPFITLFSPPAPAHAAPPPAGAPTTKPPNPLMNRGYWSRVRAVETLVQWFLDSDMGGESRRQIVNLGAGFDTAFFRLLKNKKIKKDTYWLELDFAEVVSKKKNVIGRSKVIKDLFEAEGVELRGSGQQKAKEGEGKGVVYQIVESDLRSLGKGEEEGLEGLEKGVPTLFMSECVLAYLDAGDGTRIIEWAGKTFQNSFFICYEQILPDDSFGKMMIHNLHERGCDLRSIKDFPDLSTQKLRYKNSGWGAVFAKDMYDYYYQDIEADERSRAEKLEWLDELEEWVLIQRHYCIVLAVRDESLVKSSGFKAPMK